LRLPIGLLTSLAPAECIGLPQYIKELSERLRVAYKIAPSISQSPNTIRQAVMTVWPTDQFTTPGIMSGCAGQNHHCGLRTTFIARD
ncbi:uncharacterized protein DEA37_0006307, partial [Paragonimus westermani]